MNTQNKTDRATRSADTTQSGRPESRGFLSLGQPLIRKRIARATKIKVAIVAVATALALIALALDVVFRLARRFGRPLLEKLFKKSIIAKFDFILQAKSAALILFAIFLLPGFPDDVVCYIAGLTSLPIPQLMLLVGLGRLPTIVMTNYLGAGISDNFALVAVAAVLGLLILGFFVWKREWLMRLLKGETQE